MENTRNAAFSAHRDGDLARAERLYHDLLSAAPSDAELHYCIGVLYHQTGRNAECARSLRTALEIAPNAVPVLQLLIRACAESGDAEGTLCALNQYLVQRPDDAGMFNVKGQQLVHLGRLQEAEAAFRYAAEMTGNAAMYHDLGLCRQLAGNPGGAAEAFSEALQRGHGHPKTRLWLAQCLRATGKTKEYFDAAIDAVRANPGDIETLLEAQSARRYVCDWDGFERDQTRLQSGLKRVLETDSQEDIPPGILNFLEVDEETIAAIARRHAKRLCAAGEALRHIPHPPVTQRTNTRIRLGYLSTDFFAHAVGSLVSDLFAQHDRTCFEVYGYSLRHQVDAVQARIQQGFDHYRNLSCCNAEAIARAVTEDRIDILVDLAGYTSAAQPVALAARCAPIQMSWLGYLGTSGGDFIDYIIADDIALPSEVARTYSERIIRLPHFMVASPLRAAEAAPSHRAAGLVEGEFVFCSFNQPYKLDRTTFEAWMNILELVPRSRLWMYVPDTSVCGSNLRSAAVSLGIDPDRIIFAGKETMDRHIARMSLADLALDPFHISGGATSVAALAAGVPVLTLRGGSFLARMGSSLNASLGMANLDCLDAEQYVTRAVELASCPSMLADVRKRLADAVKARGFFDVWQFARTLESAFHTAWARYMAGLPPADIRVPDDTLNHIDQNGS